MTVPQSLPRRQTPRNDERCQEGPHEPQTPVLTGCAPAQGLVVVVSTASVRPPNETIPDADASVHLDLFPFQVWGSRGRETGGEDLNRTSPRRHFLYRKSGGGY